MFIIKWSTKQNRQHGQHGVAMDIATGYLIGFFCFWAGWLACAAFTAIKGNRQQQAQDDAEQAEYLRNEAKRRIA